MIIKLVGVLEDGNPKAASVPLNPRRTITWPQGTDVTVEVQCLKTDGSAVAIDGPNAKVQMQVKRDPRSNSPDLSKTVTVLPSGLASFVFTATEQKQLAPGRFYYDVWFTNDAGKRDALIPISPLLLEFAVVAAP